MKKQNLKLLTALSYVLFTCLWGCVDPMNDDKIEEPAIETVQTPSIPLEGAIFHEDTRTWMLPQKDPYTLANFQKAYDNLTSGSSIQTLTKAQAKEFSNTPPLKATHYCLKIYPKDEKEQWKVESMKDIRVAYIPFDHVQLPEKESQKLNAVTRSTYPTYAGENRYTVTYKDVEATDDGPVETVSYAMPILYVVWPCNKPLPTDLDYEIDYEVFIPDYTAQTKTALSIGTMQILENEAISLALGTSAHSQAKTKSSVFRIVSGKIYRYDNLLKRTVPQINLKQRFQLGSNIWDIYTQENGYFNSITPIPNSAHYIHMFQHEKWKITLENSTIPYSFNWWTVESTWGSNNEIYMQPVSSTPVYEIHPAVDFFYNGYHPIRTYYYESGIRIIAMEESSVEANGYFHYSKYNQAYIKIFNNNMDNNSRLMGTTLHELGHFCHFGERGGYDGFSGVHSLLKESFASYIGWCLGELYYFCNGYKSSFDDNITGQNRESWWKTNDNTAYYSPLFVDLVDDHDQSVHFSSYNSDPIKNFPHPLIRRIAAESTDWASCKSFLQQFIGVYYTSAELDSFLAPYDYWFANN